MTPLSAIDRIFHPDCQTQSNKPFLLNDPDTVWRILSGRVEIFAVALKGGQPAGNRDHVFTAETGQLLFGLDPSETENRTGFLAVGNADARLQCLSMSEFQTAFQQPDIPEAASILIDQWVQSLSKGIIGGFRTRSDILLDAETQITLPVNSRACPRKGVVWISLTSGNATFLGLEDLPPGNGQAPIPLAEPAWIQTTTPVSLTGVSGLSACKNPLFWTGLDTFHQLAIRCQGISRNLAAVDTHNLIKEKEHRDRTRLTRSFMQLASVSRTFKKGEWWYSDIADPLLTACQMVGKSIGVSIVAPPGNLKQPEERITLPDIARASHIRIRQVMLKEGWWRRDSDALLGFTKSGNLPVALLPLSPRKYVAVHPQAGTRQVIDEAVAASLSPTAWQFYRSLPNRSLGPIDLISIGLHGCGKDFMTVAITGILGALLGLLPPLMTALIFDTVIPEASRSRLTQMMIILLVCTVGASLFDLTKSIAVLRLKGKIDPVVEASVVDRLISLPVFFYRQYNTGDLANRSMGICAISQCLSDVALQTILAGAFSSVNFLLLFWYEWRLALVTLGLSLIGIVVAIFSSMMQIRYQRVLNDIEGHISGMLLQLISGIAKLRVAGVEDRAFAAWAKNFSRKRRFIFKSRTLQNSLDTFNTAYPIVTAMIIFAWVSLKSSDQFTTGTFLAFNAAFLNFQFALLQMSTALTSIMNAAPYYERAQPILSALPEVDENKIHPGQITGDIEVSQVSFRYDADGPLVLDNVSLSVKPGEYVAIVGSSGSGKSTLLRLLLGFENAEAGTIFYDRQELTVLDIREVRRQIGVVLQNGSIMPGSIFRNIVGSSDLTLDDAWEAARMAGLDQDIADMPMGMLTMMSFGGGVLSGGQRQRLMIARAVVRKPRILFFDEATSALDNRTQAIVSNSLDNLQAARIVIAHRLSAIIHADRIVVMDQGRIVETGTYSELLAQDGPFAQLARRQMV